MRLDEIKQGKNNKIVKESVHTIPLTEDDFDELKDRLSKPIPAEIAMIALHGILESDDLSDEFLSAANVNSNQDVRPIIANWLSLNMPTEMHRFTGQHDEEFLRHGLYSTIHGYPPVDNN